MSGKLCINCVNGRLAKEKRDRQEKERQESLRAELEALSHSQRVAELEAQAVEDFRRQAREQAESAARELEKRFQEKRKVPQHDPCAASHSNLLSEYEEARNKYRGELLQQINDKKRRQEAEKLDEIRQERRQLQEIEQEKQRMMAELLEESRVQRESYKNALLTQVQMKKAKLTEEEQRKVIEKMQMDEMVEKYQSSRFGFSVCESCSQRM